LLLQRSAKKIASHDLPNKISSDFRDQATEIPIKKPATRPGKATKNDGKSSF
jgi:hypothetical protein